MNPIHPTTLVTLTIDGDKPSLITMESFFGANEQMDANERAMVIATLQASGVCHGGGGAACGWTLTFVSESLQRRSKQDVIDMAYSDEIMPSLTLLACQELERREGAMIRLRAAIGVAA